MDHSTEFFIGIDVAKMRNAGAIADHSNRTIGILAAALTAVMIILLVLALRPMLDERSALAQPES